jgi:DNA-binding response OmpR family regulator
MPVILCTGFSEAFAIEEAKRMGIREYVLKPVNWNTLSAVIDALLRNAAE